MSLLQRKFYQKVNEYIASLITFFEKKYVAAIRKQGILGNIWN